jgi:hypothetical protein
MPQRNPLNGPVKNAENSHDLEKSGNEKHKQSVRFYGIFAILINLSAGRILSLPPQDRMNAIIKSQEIPLIMVYGHAETSIGPSDEDASRTPQLPSSHLACSFIKRQHEILKAADRFHIIILAGRSLALLIEGADHPKNPRQVFEVAQSSHRRVFRGDAVQSAQFVAQNTDNDGILVRFEMTLSAAESALPVDIKSHASTYKSWVSPVTPMLVLLTLHLTNHIMRHSKLTSANQVSLLFINAKYSAQSTCLHP